MGRATASRPAVDCPRRLPPLQNVGRLFCCLRRRLILFERCARDAHRHVSSSSVTVWASCIPKSTSTEFFPSVRLANPDRRKAENQRLVGREGAGGVALARERLWLGTARASSGALRAAPRGSLGGPQRVVPERRANEHRYWPAACRAAKTVMGPQPVGRVSAARSARSLSHSHACTER